MHISMAALRSAGAAAYQQRQLIGWDGAFVEGSLMVDKLPTEITEGAQGNVGACDASGQP
jgi:hypothetical protein